MITPQTLIDTARNAGFTITRAQLERWHRAGLLPKPTQRHVDGVHGSISAYSSGTEAQLLALCRYHAKHRKLNHVAFHLWWDRYAVDWPTVRNSLRSFLPTSDAVEEFLACCDIDEPEDDAADKGTTSLCRRRPSTVVRVRSRIADGSHVETVVYNMLLIAFGGEPLWEKTTEHETSGDGELTTEDIVFRGITGQPSGWFGGKSDDLPEVVHALRAGGIRDISSLAGIVDGATDAEVEEARSNARLFLVDLPEWADRVDGALDGWSDYTDVSSIRALRTDDAVVAAALVAVCIALRRSLGREGFEAVREAVAASHVAAA